MAPITRRRKQAPKEEIPESIFDALNAHKLGDDGEDDTRKPKGNGANEPSVADLMKQIEGLNKRIESQDRSNLALTAAAPTIDVNLPAEPKINLEGLPDPLDNPKGYGEELARRTSQYNRDSQVYEAAKNTKSGPKYDGDALWEDFASEYGDYATDKEGVEFAVGLAVKQAQRRGLSVEKYMYQNSDRFFRDVTKVYDKRFGKPEQGDDGLDDTPTPRRRQREASQDDDGDEGRTGGIFGGVDGGAGSRGPQKPQPGDMIKDLQDIQRKSGYY